MIGPAYTQFWNCQGDTLSDLEFSEFLVFLVLVWIILRNLQLDEKDYAGRRFLRGILAEFLALTLKTSSQNENAAKEDSHVCIHLT